MSTVILGSVGAAVGSVFGPIGAIIGRAVGAVAGAAIDSAIISALTPAQKVSGPRLTTSDIQTSTEGAGITRLWGRARTTGQVIWATRFEEEISRETTGGKGASPKVETTTYSYFANFAVGLCEGEIAGIGRIWMDGDEVDQTEIDWRLYRGSETQAADPLILAKEGVAPAYRGLAYIVFERLALGAYGNRLPQVSVEVFRPTGRLESLIGGVAVIPGNEFGFATTEVRDGDGRSENRHTLVAGSDIEASIERLLMLAPNLRSVMLVVTWFADDLRLSDCTIRPKVVSRAKTTTPFVWSTAGLGRAEALAISVVEDIPVYGGTPSDRSVLEAIALLKRKGLAVTLCPFIMMDVIAGNGRPDPWGGAEQAALPWRGRITCHPAPGRPGTSDRSAAAAAAIAAFFGTASAADFDVQGQSIAYSGPAEWRYRRFVLHHAALCAAAGGVDSLLIGSEMASASIVRGAGGTYPFVSGLRALAAEVRSMVGPGVSIGYAADWTEWSNHRPEDGSGDVIFHLDPLWADANIDFIGIDAYFPLSDWRDGSGHLDFSPEGPGAAHDRGYLAGNVEAGEYFDWYYATPAARAAQVRTPIVDQSPFGENWIFRPKDLRSWWQNSHHDRPGGQRSAAPTAWVARSKPIRLIEYGCPAVDKGGNQPNLFPDPRSSETGFPYFSNFARDDAMQRAFLDALLGYWSDPAHNDGMVDLSRSHAWCWDHRPWPDFPLAGDWGDAPNWQTGHWLSGRLGAAPAEESLDMILAEAGLERRRIDPLPYVVDGITTNGVTSPRSLLEALQPALGFEAIESDGVIRLRDRHSSAVVLSLQAEDLVAAADDGPDWQRTRGQENEIAAIVKVSHGDPAREDQRATAEARRSTGSGLKTVSLAPPVVLSSARARELAEMELSAAWTARETVEAILPPSLIALDPGDVIRFGPTGRNLKIVEIEEDVKRSIRGQEVNGPAPAVLLSSAERSPSQARVVTRDPELVLIDGPLIRDGDLDHAGYAAGFMAPFRYGVTAWRSPGETGFIPDSVFDRPATIGVTVDPFFSGPVWRYDRVNRLRAQLLRGALNSVDEAGLLTGANALLVENDAGEWELLQFMEARLTAASTYELSMLLRGQKGSEHAMRNPVASGARVVLVNEALRQTAIATSDLGLSLNWRVGPADRSVSDALDAGVIVMAGRGRRPLSPVHLKAGWDGGDIVIRFIRRSRISADGFDQVDVPLGETVERYEVELIAANGTVARLFEIAQPFVRYTAEQRAADGLSIPFDFIAYQLSETFGRGIGARSRFYG